MFFSDNIEHPKWTEWCNKSEEESTQIAEQNEWLWYFDWFDVGDVLRYHYEKADTSPNVTKKYNGIPAIDRISFNVDNGTKCRKYYPKK